MREEYRRQCIKAEDEAAKERAKKREAKRNKHDLIFTPSLFGEGELCAEHVCEGETIVNYFVASWKSGGAGDCLDKIADYNITHWRYINKPKGVEE